VSCSGEIEKCSLLERQKLSAEGQLEGLAQRLNGILGLSSADTVSPTIEDMTNKVRCFLQLYFTSMNNFCVV